MVMTSPGRTSTAPGVKCTSRPSRARPVIRAVAASFASLPGSDQDLDRATYQCAVLFEGNLLLEPDKPLVPLLHDTFGKLLGKFGSRGAGPFRVLEGEQPKSGPAPRPRVSGRKSSSVSPGNPDDVGGDGGLGHSRPNPLQNPQILLGPVGPSHGPQHPVGTGLQGGMCSAGQTFGVCAMASITSSVNSAGCGEVNRTRSSPSISPHERRSAAKAPGPAGCPSRRTRHRRR